MGEGEKREFPDWERLYRTEKVEKMPWFQEGLDKDLASALKRLKITSGSVLDLGTGPGTQAVALCLMGFAVTATDLSATAVRNAEKDAMGRGLRIDWREDDILRSRLRKRFDLIFDRGCFHVLAPEQRPVYVRTVCRLLKPGGYLFLKCFSNRETKMKGGPHRFTPAMIREAFSVCLEALDVKNTEFHGTLKEYPKALFCVLRKK